MDNSPKIKYTIECIKTLRKHHENTKTPLSGQVIYSNVGKDYFKYIKEYLEKEVGFKKSIKFNRTTLDEVEIITSAVTLSKKEAIKEAFLEGVVKVIIGSATIREGIDLQRKGTVIYNLYPDYNPTDVRQLEGRIWRQGNEFGYIRVVMPLIQNSLDVFIFQKLEEKSSRINDIWAKSSDESNVLDQDSLNPEAIKFALYTNINKLVSLKLFEIELEINKSRKKIENELNTLKEVEVAKKIYNSSKEYIHTRIEDFKSLANIFFIENENKTSEAILKNIEQYKVIVQAIDLYDYLDDKALVNIGIKIQRLSSNFFSGGGYGYNDKLGDFRGVLSKINKTESILAKYDNAEDAINKISELIIAQDKKLKELKTRDFQEKIYNEIVEEKKKLNIEGRTPQEAAKDFSDLNYLLDYEMADVDGIVGNPLPSDKPKSSQTEDNGKDKRIRINKGKLKLLQLKMNELSGIYA